jgi:S1-C subfamily serine protease
MKKIVNNQTKKEIINDLFTKPSQGSTQLSRLLVLSITLSVVAGVISGLIGVTMILSGSLAKAPFFKAFTLETILPERQFIIRQQQDVTVAEDRLLSDLIVKSDPTIVTFVKQKIPNQTIGAVFTNSDVLGHGTILTADGWLMVEADVLSSQAISNIQVLTATGKIYEIDDLVADKLSQVSFVKIQADNLIVAPIVESFEFKTGETLVTLTRSLPSAQPVIDKINVRNLDETQTIQSTEELSRKINIIASRELKSAPVLNLAGEFVGLLSKTSAGTFKLIPVYHFMSVLPEVLKNSELRRPYLGIEWINLHGNTGLLNSIHQDQNKGVYIYGFNLDSPALAVGLEIGDIIRKVNDLELNGALNLSEVIQQHNPSDKIFLNVLREQEELEFEIILDAF